MHATATERYCGYFCAAMPAPLRTLACASSRATGSRIGTHWAYQPATSMRFKCCVSLLRNRCCLCPYGEEHCVTRRQRELLRNGPVGTLGQIYFFDENSTQKETMKPLFYSRKRSKKIELRVMIVSEQQS